jgi:hypothetical protein
MHQNPYAEDLGSVDPLTALTDTPERIRALVEGWSLTQWEQRYAPGKWTARQVIVHLAQTELALTARVRFAASRDGYVAQAFSQDDWLPLDDHADGRTALGAYTALRKLNILMFRNLTPAQRTRSFTHPEYGQLTAEWVAAQIAGHEIHHLKQLEAIKSA